MSYIYLTAMIIVFIIAHIGINSKYKSLFISTFSLITIFIILVFLSGFRSEYSIGDTFSYTHSYRLIGQNPDLAKADKDMGFVFLMILLNKITNNPQIFIFCMAFVTNLFIILALYKYSKSFELGIFLYFGTVLFYVTMNGIRQSLVAAILVWAVRFIIDNKWKSYFILVLLLSTLHQSALIFIPLYFIVRKEAWGKTFWTLIIVSLAMMVAFKPMLGVIAGILDNTVYSNYGKDMLTSSSSTNIIRLFITLVPLILAYFVKDRLKEEWPESRIFIYMSLFNFIFMMLSTQYLYFYRVCIYFDLYNLVLLPRIISFYSKQKRTSLYVYAILFYSIFSWYQVNLWNDHYFNVLLS